jgi:hypothetical protein
MDFPAFLGMRRGALAQLRVESARIVPGMTSPGHQEIDRVLETAPTGHGDAPSGGSGHATVL